MATRKPLVLGGGGHPEQLQTGDSLDGAGGAKGVATINLPAGRGVLEWTEEVAAAAVLATDDILCQLAPGSDADENTAAMIDLTTLVAVAGAGTIAFTITLSIPLSGPVLILWKVI